MIQLHFSIHKFFEETFAYVHPFLSGNNGNSGSSGNNGNSGNSVSSGNNGDTVFL